MGGEFLDVEEKIQVDKKAVSFKRINGNYHLPTYQRDNYGPYKSEIYQAVPIFAVEVGDIGQGLGQDNTGDVSEVPGFRQEKINLDMFVLGAIVIRGDRGGYYLKGRDYQL